MEVIILQAMHGPFKFIFVAFFDSHLCIHVRRAERTKMSFWSYKRGSLSVVLFYPIKSVIAAEITMS